MSLRIDFDGLWDWGTMEKYARALEVPLYKLFYDGDGAVQKLKLPSANNDDLWGVSGKEHREFRLFAHALSRMNDKKRRLLFFIAQKMARPRAK